MVKSETRRDAETLLKNSRLYCKKLKTPRLKETHKKETSTPAHHDNLLSKAVSVDINQFGEIALLSQWLKT